MSKPACYELGWRSEDRSLIIGFDPSFLTGYWPAVAEFAERNLPTKTKEAAQMDGEFITPAGTEPWGFGGALVPTERAPRFTLPCHRVVIPAAFWGERYQGLTELLNVVASLGVFFDALAYPEQYEDSTPQGPPTIAELYGFRLELGGLYGSTIHARLFEPALEFITEIAETGEWRYPPVEQAMMEAHLAMFPEEEVDRWLRDRFQTHIGANELHLSVPGNACGLDPIDRGLFDPPQTMKLCPHNTDRPTQQLTLAVGIAALCDAVREHEAHDPIQCIATILNIVREQ